MDIGNEIYTKQKNRKKMFKVFFQLTFLSLLAYTVIKLLFTFDVYQPYEQQSHISYNGDQGFTAISYFGVDRTSGSNSLIGVEILEKHLSAIKNAGFVTITQQDIIDYYQKGKVLPERSVFLIFEDGRRDTAIFAQKILEKFNFKGTILTYAENLNSHDTKFLRADELLELEKTSYWEFGTNGYRLFFINVFDRYDNYLGELAPLEHSMVAPYLGRKYNHYLMDYVRDENGFPRESYRHMKRRIDYDYETLAEEYMYSIRRVPGMYILMHSNTGSFGNNDKVSSLNEYWIKKIFQLNFDREGFSLNEKVSSIYDLTRMQPQAYWYPNHLIMRIKDDNKQELPFVVGDLRRQQFWEVEQGALEVDVEKIILTSPSEGVGRARLKNIFIRNCKISTRFTGNKLGMQRILLRADGGYNNYISVQLLNNHLYIIEKISGTEHELFKLNLDEFDEKPILSIPEDKNAAEAKELETFLRYAPNKEKAAIFTKRLANKKVEKVAGIEEAPIYKPALSIHARGDRAVEILLKDDYITVNIDNKLAAGDIPLLMTDSGGVLLESRWGGHGWSQRNIVDDVYDGVFEDFKILSNLGLTADQERIIFEDKPEKFEFYKLKLLRYWEELINVFITYF